MKEASPSRQLGLTTVIALVAGGMIGSGIFYLPALLAEFGPISLFGWIFASIGGLTLASIFGKLSKAIPESGGSYAYTKAAFGEYPAFVVAWGYWLSMWSTNAAIALTFAGYFGVFFPEVSDSKFFAPTVALIVIWLLTAINSKSIRTGGNLQVITTIIKIIPIILVAVAGFFFFDIENFSPLNISEQTDFTAISSSTLLCFYAFLGIEAASIPADNIKDPGKNIIRGTMLGAILVTVIYILSTTSVFGVLAPEVAATSAAPLSDAAIIIFGENAGWLVAIGACVSTFGALNCWILVQGQIAQSMARDGLLVKPMAYINKGNSPSVAIIVSSLFITLLLGLNVTKGMKNIYAFMVELTTLTSLVFYFSAVLVLGFFSWKKQKGFEPTIKNMLLFLIGTGFCIWLGIGANGEVLFWSFISLLAGTPIYLYQKNKQK